MIEVDIVWEKVEYNFEYNMHCVVLYFTEEHVDHNIRWAMNDWCEQEFGKYADLWYSNFKQAPKNENQDMYVAYNFCFTRKDDAMKFKLVMG